MFSRVPHTSLRVMLVLAFLFTTLHATGHTHHDGKIHDDCSQYIFLQQYSAENTVQTADIISLHALQTTALPLYDAFIYSYITYGTLYANAPPLR